MQIPPVTAIQPSAAPVASASVLSSDFETFLQMLTAQAKYQDPLEPIDSSEYAAQLAQFSMVEQQVLSNDLLTSLGTQMGSGNMSQMASWIGMEARTTAPVAFDGASITVVGKPATGAEEMFLIAFDASGQEVQRKQIPNAAGNVEWDGLLGDGTSAPAGLYTFAIESRAVGASLGTTPAETYARVTEARREGSATSLILNGGSSVESGAVTALREAPIP